MSELLNILDVIVFIAIFFLSAFLATVVGSLCYVKFNINKKYLVGISVIFVLIVSLSNYKLINNQLTKNGFNQQKLVTNEKVHK